MFGYPLIWSSCPSSSSVFSGYVNFTCLNTLHLIVLSFLFICLQQNNPSSDRPVAPLIRLQQVRELHMFEYPYLTILSLLFICLQEVCKVHMFEYPLIWSKYPSSSSVFSEYVNFTSLKTPSDSPIPTPSSGSMSTSHVLIPLIWSSCTSSSSVFS